MLERANAAETDGTRKAIKRYPDADDILRSPPLRIHAHVISAANTRTDDGRKIHVTIIGEGPGRVMEDYHYCDGAHRQTPPIERNQHEADENHMS